MKSFIKPELWGNRFSLKGTGVLGYLKGWYKALYDIRYIISFISLCLLGCWKIIDVLIWLIKHIKIV